MKILICSDQPMVRELGISKVLVELADELPALGWSCEIFGPERLRGGVSDGKNFARVLALHLEKHGGEYDVVDYPAVHLPEPVARFHPRTLFVARSALLHLHFQSIRLPWPRPLRSKLATLMRWLGNRARLKDTVSRTERTMAAADLINVNNDADRTLLIARGVSPAKIVVLPLGIDRKRRARFDAIAIAPPSDSRIVFIGTFDHRKGEVDLPLLLEQICDAVPNASLRLLGTGRARSRVLDYFPRALRDRVEVIPSFAADQLPALLADCAIGLFPSHLEGFGLGVLEMLAAGVPVLAYDVPGPPMMLSPAYLVKRGDAFEMGRRAISLLDDRGELARARVWAKERSQKFDWPAIARATVEIYSQRLQEKRRVS